jgi:YjbE family integral membrane protein
MMEFLSEVQTAAFWTGLLAIIWVNIILSGDNAVVIALAARSLPVHQQGKAVFWGAAAAVVLRIILTIFAVALLKYPYLKLVGGALLFWIAVKLLVPEDDGGADIDSSDNLFQAIKTILIADLIMSLDNVVAVAAVAKGSILLLILGLVISIPLVVYGATILMKLMGRYPVIVTIGAALIGYVAGEMLVTDPVVIEWFTANAHWLIDFEVFSIFGAKLELSAAGLIGAAIVVAAGKWLAARAEAGLKEVVDLGEGGETKAPR